MHPDQERSDFSRVVFVIVKLVLWLCILAIFGAILMGLLCRWVPWEHF